MPITYDRKSFFDAVRDDVFGGSMSAGQVSGIDAILSEWEATQPSGDTRFLAYALGTAKWETASKMQPIKEYGNDAYFTRMYDVRGARPQTARVLGNVEPGDGARFPGRGLCQTTGRRNYGWASTIVGQDCVADPDLLLDPKWASKVMFVGMLGGHYTGKKLADYFHGAASDWIGARRIINGTDHAADVAKLAETFFAALKGALVYSATASRIAAALPTIAATSAPATAVPSAPVSKPRLFARIIRFFSRRPAGTASA